MWTPSQFVAAGEMNRRRAACARVLGRFEDERGRRLAEREAGAVDRERPARAARSGVIAEGHGREHAHRLPARDDARGQQRFAAADDGDVDPAGTDRAHRLADRDRRRRARA
jgi:hypothetical protein